MPRATASASAERSVHYHNLDVSVIARGQRDGCVRRTPSMGPLGARYVARRRAEGKSTGEIVRILKRYVAREVFKQLRPLAVS